MVGIEMTSRSGTGESSRHSPFQSLEPDSNTTELNHQQHADTNIPESKSSRGFCLEKCMGRTYQVRCSGSGHVDEGIEALEWRVSIHLNGTAPL
jgi:hypothetical protein